MCTKLGRGDSSRLAADRCPRRAGTRTQPPHARLSSRRCQAHVSAARVPTKLPPTSPAGSGPRKPGLQAGTEDARGHAVASAQPRCCKQARPSPRHTLLPNATPALFGGRGGGRSGQQPAPARCSRRSAEGRARTRCVCEETRSLGTDSQTRPSSSSLTLWLDGCAFFFFLILLMSASGKCKWRFLIAPFGCT